MVLRLEKLLWCISCVPLFNEGSVYVSYREDKVTDIKRVILYILSAFFWDAGLRKLDLEACDDVDEAVLRSLVRLTNLRSLNLVDCRLLSQAGLAFITSRMRPRCKVYHGYW